MENRNKGLYRDFILLTIIGIFTIFYFYYTFPSQEENRIPKYKIIIKNNHTYYVDRYYLKDGCVDFDIDNNSYNRVKICGNFEIRRSIISSFDEEDNNNPEDPSYKPVLQIN